MSVTEFHTRSPLVGRSLTMIRAFVLLLGLLFVEVVPAQETRAPAQVAEPNQLPHNFARWEKEIAAFEAADRMNPPPKGGILFTGSSTIRLWKTLAQDYPQHKVINRGFGGSEIADA